MRITTKYQHNDNSGPKIVAKAAGRQRTIPYDHALGYDGSHRKAADTLAAVLDVEVTGPLVAGATNRHRRVYVVNPFRVGDWADHVNGQLDPREVVGVAGEFIDLAIGTTRTGLVPADNYTVIRRGA